MIGGFAQGKLDYVIRKYRLDEDAVWDGVMPEGAGLRKKTVVFHHFHRWVRDCMLNGGCPEEEVRMFLERCGECIIISDEIGNGIVPAEAFEREYRERMGRILVGLAEEAEGVERVICGIGQKLR